MNKIAQHIKQQDAVGRVIVATVFGVIFCGVPGLLLSMWLLYWVWPFLGPFRAVLEAAAACLTVAYGFFVYRLSRKYK